ncbi:MAG: RNA polymerase sigma factor [Leptolyngbya sp. SIO3F4]|nr:RNA polymerase sigma factor [Leptolyngbya sp. SIO3F4]
MDKLSDNALMLQVKAGKTEKLALLFERHYKPLFGYFYHLTQNRQNSEDLAQNTFYKILKNRSKFNGEGTFRAWMYTIARNNSFDFFKKNKNHHQSEEIGYWEDKLPEGSDIVKQITESEDKELLKIALTKMDTEKRELLILSKFQGMKYKEIGLILRCSENTVKVKVYRALETLKQIYCQLNINKDYDL